MKNLSEQELKDINGGGLSGSDATSFGISISATTDSLLNITFTRSYGDQLNTTTLSVLNNVKLDLGFKNAGS